MNHNEYIEYADKLLEFLPNAEAMAVNDGGYLHFYNTNKVWPLTGSFAHGGISYYLGKIDYSGDWRDTLVVRKWIPKIGQAFFIPDILSNIFYYENKHHCPEFIKYLLERNLVFKTKEEAISRAKELLGIKE